MAHHFDAKNAPFDRLTAEEVDTVRDALDIVYFRPNETIVGRDKAPDSLFIVIKGLVEERDGDDLVALRGPGDAFDSRALADPMLSSPGRKRSATCFRATSRFGSSTRIRALPRSSTSTSPASLGPRRGRRKRRALRRCWPRGFATFSSIPQCSWTRRTPSPTPAPE
jgi:hypothetical protein